MVAVPKRKVRFSHCFDFLDPFTFHAPTRHRQTVGSFVDVPSKVMISQCDHIASAELKPTV